MSGGSRLNCQMGVSCETPIWMLGGSLSVAWDSGRTLRFRALSEPSLDRTGAEPCDPGDVPNGLAAHSVRPPQSAASRRLIPPRRPVRIPVRDRRSMERALASALRATRPKPLALGLRRFRTLLRCRAFPRGMPAFGPSPPPVATDHPASNAAKCIRCTASLLATYDA